MKRTKSLFYKVIRCSHCGGYFKLKREKSGRKIYLCSQYDNTGECERNVIEEEYLVELLQRRFNEDITPELIRKEVMYISIEKTKPYLMTIQFRNQSPIEFTLTGIKF